YAAAGVGVGDQTGTALTMQNVALQNAGDIRAINLSWGLSYRASPPDGTSLLTKFLDWSAVTNHTLYVTASYQKGGGGTLPKDEYNGITVAASQLQGGIFSRVDPDTFTQLSNTSTRRYIDLVAPGV